MATRSVEFFMTPQEFAEFVSVDLAPLNLELFVVEGGGWTASMQDPCRPHYLGPRGVERPVTSRLDLIWPAREGWISVNPRPLVEGTTLYLAVLAAKDQWLDLDTKTTTANPEVLRLFGQVARKLRKRLIFSVLGFSLSSHESNVYRSIGHSEGARAWLENSGSWRQYGNINTGFKLP